MVLFAHPGVGALTLALLFGLFNLIYGGWALTRGIELRRTGKSLHSVAPDRRERTARPEPARWQPGSASSSRACGRSGR